MRHGLAVSGVGQQVARGIGIGEQEDIQLGLLGGRRLPVELVSEQFM